jgi:hypothetical protein
VSCLRVGCQKHASAVLDQVLESLGGEAQRRGVSGAILALRVPAQLGADNVINRLFDGAQLGFAARVPDRGS